ncbi:MAG: dipeptidase [Acidimicrobiia bacterium]|nr:MAG: dipeptidase [Acidimicrobiia bacterium]
MCDTLCVAAGGGMLFAKSSDRPVGEAQVFEHHPRRAAGGALRTQYLTIPDAGAHALVGSRPTWMWGLEHGVNEHGLAIGNEKIWTVDDPRGLPPALLGMDLVRLALERARDADAAVDVIAALLEEHGQGGSGEADRDEPYFSSFLVADARGGWVVETSGRTWAARPVTSGAAISNRVTLRSDWTRASADVEPGRDFDAWRAPRVPTAIADHRLAVTSAAVERAGTADARALVATLRHHGERPWGRPGAPPDDVSPPPAELGADLSGVTVCMHVRGVQVTAASMVAELPADGRRGRCYVCLGSPCTGVFVPTFPPAVPPSLASPREWARFDGLRARVEERPGALAEVRAVLGPIEAELWDEADDLASRDDPAAERAFAGTVWERVDTGLRRLGA